MKKHYLHLLLAGAGLIGFSALKAQPYTQGDIYTMVQAPVMTHDSTICASTSNMITYDITISNSFSGDSVFVVDQSTGQLIQADGNANGASPWNLTIQVPIYNPYVQDNQLLSGIAQFNGPVTKVVSGTDTIYNMYNNYSLNVPNPCGYGNVSGMVYIDNNGDCSYNAGDVPLQPMTVGSTATLNSPNANTSFANGYTDMNGMYNMEVQESWMTSYTVAMPAAYQFIFPITACFPGSYTFNTLPQANVNFPLQCSNNIDVQCYAGSPAFARPQISFYMQPYVSNTGCDSASGQMKLIKDSRVIYDPALSNNPADAVVGDTLIWNYSNLTNLSNGAYWNSFMSDIYLTPDNTVNIGDTLRFRIFTNVAANDLNAANNDYSIAIPVVNSYDPNMKEVSPKGTGAAGNIPATTPSLTYTIHFQNTGNATAYNVSVVDTLDGDVTATSLKILGSSHNMSPEWLAPGVVRFNFYGINLPDSNANEAASHGFVRFSVNMHNNLPVGTQIKNKGYIYFDSNPAIITNTALNTIAAAANVQTVPGANGVISIYPNPANDHIMIEMTELNKAKVSILNVQGAVVTEQDITTLKTEIKTDRLPQGMYLLKITDEQGSTMKKFVKQ